MSILFYHNIEAVLSARNQRLIALLISAFAIGSTEFVIMGILPDVANVFDCYLSEKGLLVTGSAPGVVIGGQIIIAVPDVCQVNRCCSVSC
ncbi:MFS transporter [Peribacillus simplex]|uniref:MFS transporter n=2 Tax=Peribacillus simplex TaxID=1478 RepID=A0AAW7IJP7_9BACI|nr:MFS transporter [Peribacillus simplex]